ncbi:MAG: hypothetical protein QXT30_06995 [Candidatus Bathyarchaeia archaeon]
MKITQTALLLISAISLTLYFLPAYSSIPISVDSKWSYYYKEKLVSGGKMVYEADEELNYSVVGEKSGILIVELNRTFRHKHFSEGSAEFFVLNGSNIQLFFIDPQKRMYHDGTYTSWWIPTNVFIGSLIPVWNLNFYVKGLLWTIIDGRLIECWVLEYRNAWEEYVILYERTSGIFIRLDIKRQMGLSQTLVIERRLRDAGRELPLQATLRPLLAIVGAFSAAALLLRYARRIRRYLSRPREEHGPILT